MGTTTTKVYDNECNAARGEDNKYIPAIRISINLT